MLVEYGRNEKGGQMKIRVAILDSDKSYLERITKVFNIKYADNLQIYSFTDEKTALLELGNNKIKVFLAAEQFDIDRNEMPQNCGFAYLVENQDIYSIKGQPAICKFQKIDLIYKQMLSIYSDLATNISGMKFANKTCEMIGFTSPAGGVGTSTVAAAFATYCARIGKRVIYLNFEMFGSSDTFFNAEGQYDMSDIIYALKTRKSNVAIKIESCVKKDPSGVCFFSQPKTVLDYMEMSVEEMLGLLNELQISGQYDVIVVDMDFMVGREARKIWEQMDSIVMVSDGSVNANMKLFRAYGTLQIIEEGMEETITNRLVMVYNKFSNKTGRMLEALDIRTIGGAPRYEHATSQQIVEQLVGKAFFDKLI